MPFFDYHIHTVRCKHAEGTMEQYVQSAVAAGLTEIGFSDHLPLPFDGPSPFNMLRDELPQYVRDVEAMRRKFPQIAIRLGVEMDFFAGYERQLRELIDSQSLDYVIGSVHYIPPGSISRTPPEPAELFCVDSPTNLQDWAKYKVDDVYRAHIAQLEAMAKSGLCQIVAHLDLPKKFGFRYSPAILEDYRRLAKTIAANGLLCEINSAGLRKPVKEMYPSLDLLKILRAAGVGITLGSDSHKPDEVGRNFAQAVALAKSAGYDRIYKWSSPAKFAPTAIVEM